MYGSVTSSTCHETDVLADDSLLPIDWLDPSLLLPETAVVQQPQPANVTQSLLQRQSTTCSGELADEIRRRRESNRRAQRRHQQKKQVPSTS